MTNHTNNLFRHAAFAFAFAASISFAGAQAQNLNNPGESHSNSGGGAAESTAAIESAPSPGPGTTWTKTIAPTQNHGSSAHPSTSANENEPPTNRCAYDFNSDGFVDFADYLQLLSLMANEVETAGPANLGFDDIVGLLSEWGGC